MIRHHALAELLHGGAGGFGRGDLAEIYLHGLAGGSGLGELKIGGRELARISICISGVRRKHSSLRHNQGQAWKEPTCITRARVHNRIKFCFFLHSIPLASFVPSRLAPERGVHLDRFYAMCDVSHCEMQTRAITCTLPSSERVSFFSVF